MTHGVSRERLNVALIWGVIVAGAIMLAGDATRDSASGLGSVLWPIAAFGMAAVVVGSVVGGRVGRMISGVTFAVLYTGALSGAVIWAGQGEGTAFLVVTIIFGSIFTVAAGLLEAALVWARTPGPLRGQ
jgi:hypothetical protein